MTDHERDLIVADRCSRVLRAIADAIDSRDPVRLTLAVGSLDLDSLGVVVGEVSDRLIAA